MKEIGEKLLVLGIKLSTEASSSNCFVVGVFVLCIVFNRCTQEKYWIFIESNLELHDHEQVAFHSGQFGDLHYFGLGFISSFRKGQI
jgi:hypothetical protein